MTPIQTAQLQARRARLARRRQTGKALVCVDCAASFQITFHADPGASAVYALYLHTIDKHRRAPSVLERTPITLPPHAPVPA